MKKRPKRKGKDLPFAAPIELGPMHFRLCHFCLHLNESSSEIITCVRCTRYLTFDPLTESLSDEERIESEVEKVTSRLPTEDDFDFEEGIPFRRRIKKLTGLSVVW